MTFYDPSEDYQDRQGLVRTSRGAPPETPHYPHIDINNAVAFRPRALADCQPGRSIDFCSSKRAGPWARRAAPVKVGGFLTHGTFPGDRYSRAEGWILATEEDRIW